MKNFRTTLAKAVMLPALLIPALPSAAADKPVELRFANWLPPQHALARTGFEPWAKSVEEASGGSIKVTLYPAQQLGKAADHYDMTRDGIADMAWVSPGYQAGRFPIYAASELPFLFSTPGAGSAAVDAWYRAYADKEMGDVKFCFSHMHVGTLHSKQPITDPDQLKGMKVRPANGTVAQTMTALGATNVQVSAPEARDALDKGVADAITFPWNSLITFNVHRAANHHTDMRLYAANFVWVMNKRWYDNLSGNQRKVIDDHCNNEWAGRVGTAWGDEEDSGRDKLAAMGDQKLVPLTDAQLGKWKQAVQPVYDVWAKSLPGGNAGSVLDALKKEIASRNAGL